ncbi:uncharacterized protein EI90DRAFT_3072176, partial [Cantharellus anzutake]|uniref:uncharacterized protein n=1 Tax=Cantharellus anzutake TaxID=1750568 RepID=UPI001906D64F
MWARASSLSNEDLVGFDIRKDLVEVRSGPTAYGQILFGRIRIPAVNDELGEGFVHVRVHHSPGEEQANVTFHSIQTEESYHRAIHKKDDPFEFF